MELSELILQVLHSATNAADYYTRGAHMPAAETLALISNEITKELPKIKLPPKESPQCPEH